VIVDWGKVDEALTGKTITGEDLFAAALLLAVGFFLAWLVRRWSKRLLTRLDVQSEPLVALAARVAQVLVVAVFAGWALSRLGADIGWLTLVVVVGVFIAVLAARPIVEGLGAGAALTTRAAFSVGDEIGVDAMVGEVIDITSRTTVIRTRDGRQVHIPNVKMLDKTVTVYTAAAERRSAVEVIVRFDTDLDHVREVIRGVLAEVDGITRLGSIRGQVVASGIELSIRFWHSPGIQAGNDARDGAIPAILNALANEGI
jgi:small conductance mechanosensitive channel